MSQLKQSTAVDKLVFMTDSADHISGKTGLTLTITASKAGGAVASITPTVTERGNGWYSLALTTGHTDTLGDLGVHITGTGADPTDVLWEVVTELTGQLANDAITAAKIATNAITNAKIADDAITTAKLAINSITASRIATDAIGASQIAAVTAITLCSQSIKCSCEDTVIKVTYSETSNYSFQGLELTRPPIGVVWTTAPGGLRRGWPPTRSVHVQTNGISLLGRVT